jgi:hypothetical protein
MQNDGSLIATGTPNDEWSNNSDLADFQEATGDPQRR